MGKGIFTSSATSDGTTLKGERNKRRFAKNMNSADKITTKNWQIPMGIRMRLFGGGLLGILTIFFTGAHLVKGFTVISEPITYAVLGIAWVCSITYMIFWGGVNCPECNQQKMRLQKERRKEAKKFLCSNCNTLWITQVIETIHPHDHKK